MARTGQVLGCPDNPCEMTSPLTPFFWVKVRDVLVALRSSILVQLLLSKDAVTNVDRDVLELEWGVVLGVSMFSWTT